MDPQQADPKGLIRESYRIEGISGAECRSILIDWALSLPAGVSQPQAIEVLLERYAGDAPEHPMTALLRDGLGDTPDAPTGRRGGRAARVSKG